MREENLHDKEREIEKQAGFNEIMMNESGMRVVVCKYIALRKGNASFTL